MLGINTLKSFVQSLIWLRYYGSIETLPVIHWFKINDTGNTRLLAKNNREFIIGILVFVTYLLNINIAFALGFVLLLFIYAPIEIMVMNRIYKRINDQFLKQIGLSNEYKEYLENMRQYADLMCNYIIDPSPINKAIINEKKAEIEDFKTKESENIYKVIAHLSRAQGHPIDPQKVTVIEFYSMIQTINEKKPNAK